MSEAFLHGNGGGSGLNFKVVGNPQPSSPAENTIWVNTDIPITSYVFSATEPTEPAEGMVWIKTDNSGPVEINALKKNQIQVYPVSVKQYVNGAWVDVVAKIYQDGTWKDLALWLFNSGDMCETVTGGWVATSIRNTGGDTAYTPTLEISDVLSISMPAGSSSNRRGSVAPKNNYIDFTNYSQLIVETASKTSGELGIYIASTNSDGYNANRIAMLSLADTDAGVYTLDVSAINQSGYLLISVNAITNSPVSAEIREIRLDL